MSAPKRWLDDELASSPRERELLAAAKPTPAMPADVRAASTAKVAELATKTALGLGVKIMFTVLALAVGVAVVMQVTSESAPPQAFAESDQENSELTEPEPAGASSMGDPEQQLAVEPQPAQSDTPALRPRREAEPERAEAQIVPRAASDTADIVPQVAEVADVADQVAEADTADVVAQVAEPDTLTEADTLAAEVALIERGRAAMTHDPAAALEAAFEHLRTYPHGQLSAAAQLIAIDALMRLGRDGEAAAQARAMLQRFPASIYRERLVRLVGEDALE